jgi:hypothetical protein
MQIEFSRADASLFFAGTKKPSITGATRLETQPTSVSLKTGLQAPIADPLWMLARQWQFNEFQGEDAGTPLAVKFAVKGRPVNAFRAGTDPAARWETLERGGAPLETRVEAEAAWKTHPRLRGEAGLHALRMAPSAAVRSALIEAYALGLDPPTDPDADQPGLLWSTLFNRRTIDAARLAADLALLVDAGGRLSALPAALNIAAAHTDAAKSMLEAWFAWASRLVYEGAGDAAQGASRSWQRDRMEYAFSLASGNVALRSDEYTDGRVDWEDFRATALPAQSAPPAPAAQRFEVARRHPSPVRYPGMPAERYWAFEDANVNFAGAEAGVTDLLRLTVTEFALTFGNDWFIVPVRLPVGSLYEVDGFEVTDTFGVAAQPRAIQAAGASPWTMFEMSADANLQGTVKNAVFIPDSLDGVQEGAVLEHTLLARDEMANLAWAIEKKVQGVSGEPLDRELEAKGLAFQQQIHFDTAPDSPQLVYRLATPVPANWTPLLPVRDPKLNLADPLEIRLARAGMKRFYPEADVAVIGVADEDYKAFLDLLDAQDNFIERLTIGQGLRAYVFYPRGWLLRRDPTQPMAADDTLVIEEEEVPRIGASLKRKFQYARSSDGKSWLWIGRSKIAGRGEAASQLRFDVAVKQRTLR